MSEEARAVTGRPNDIVAGEVQNSTFSSRAAARAKEVSAARAENKKVAKRGKQKAEPEELNEADAPETK
jgi:hypothetical protein